MLANLLNNAFQFTDKGTVSARVGNTDSVWVTIKPYLIVVEGYKLEIMPRLFQRFASRTDAGNGNGTGLGLYISKAII